MTSWISVKITDGLFPSERTVQLPTTDGEISVFVSGSQVDEEKSELEVILLDQDEQYALVQLPSQCDMTVAKVDRGLLRK